ncbi:MAG TPA: hypothetical protein VF314_09460 [Actinomycetes bacterium]
MTRSSRTRLRRAAGHLCPECRELWALVALRIDDGFLVSCRYCDYRRPVLTGAPPRQRSAPPL